MDGLKGVDSAEESKKNKFRLKVLFLLMCTPHAKDKELQYLDEYINSDKFSLDSVSSMSVKDIVSRIKKMGMQNKNASYI